MNKSFFALIFALPLLAACFGKKAENNEVVKTEAVHEEMAPVSESAHDEASEAHDDAAEHSENDEK